jgi:hypothetical protein
LLPKAQQVYETGRWKERLCEYPGRSAHTPKKKIGNLHRKVQLSEQKSAEAVVPAGIKKKQGRAEHKVRTADGKLARRT